MLKRIVFAGLLLALCLATISCAPQKTGGPVTINMWMMPNSLEPLRDIQETLKPFEDANPGIKVKVTVMDWGAAWSKITTAATSNDVPDIVQLGSTWVGAISGIGALEDLSPRVKELGGAAAFVPASWKTSGILNSKKVTAVPWIVDARALFYRTDVFKKLNLTAADLATWDRFQATLKKIKEAKLTIEGLEIAPLGMPGKNDWNVVHNLSPWIWGAGGDFLSADLNDSVINTPQALDGVYFYVNLAKQGLVPIEYLELNTAQVSSNFNNGSVAMMFDGPYEVRTMTTPPAQGGASESITARNFAVVPYPQGPKGRYTFIGGSNLAIFRAAKHKEEAFKVIKYLTTDKNAQLTYCKASGFLPAKLSVFNEPYFSVDPARRVFREAIRYGKAYPCIPQWGVLEPILTRRFGILWDYVTGSQGELDKKEIGSQLELAKKEMETIIKQGK